ncbi:hypothetical protein Scep_028345 [Stephania cephalantha]|uniref:Uncharacterized protein n=1 Tax=Stephania cephalantha TaxID=152367 RepID=A0AAP0HI24_9MAGN
MPSPFEISTTNGASTYLGNASCTPSFRIGSSFGTSNTKESVESWSSNTKVSSGVENPRTLLYVHPLQGLTNMHGRVSGFTNTRGWSSLFSFWGSSDLFEMTSISFSASSSSYCAIVMSRLM